MSLTKKFLGLFPAYRQAVSNEKVNLELFQEAREELLALRKQIPKIDNPVATEHRNIPTVVETPLYVSWEDFKGNLIHREGLGVFIDKVRLYALSVVKSITVSAPVFSGNPGEGVLIVVFKVSNKETLSILEYVRTLLKLYRIPPEMFSAKYRPGEITVIFNQSKVLRNLTEEPKHWSRQD